MDKTFTLNRLFRCGKSKVSWANWAFVPERAVPQSFRSDQLPAPLAVTRQHQNSPEAFKTAAGLIKSTLPTTRGPPYNPHSEYPHINITLPNGKTLAVVVTGSKSF